MVGLAENRAMVRRGSSTEDAESKRRKLQRRVDEILSGRAVGYGAAVPEKNRRLFAAFAASDQQSASALAAAWMNMADREGGLKGLKRAIDHMYKSLGEDYPLGMVRYAAALFLTHYEPARQHLSIRNLEELQPGMVQPSDDYASAHAKRRLIAGM